MTNNSRAVVLIAGAGQLGSRHLQGLVACQVPLEIYVQDVSEQSLDRAVQRWAEVGGPASRHYVSFIREIESLPRHLDLAIVATNADVRPRVVTQIADHCEVGAWVLEKVLAQSESALKEIIQCVGAESLAWVNTPRRMIPWHREIKAQMGLCGPLNLTVEGGAWGLACNAVHFLDLLSWWTGESLVEVRTGSLDRSWFESKRPGNWEIFGTLEANFSGGSKALLRTQEGDVFYSMTVSDGCVSWEINEFEGLANRSDGNKISGRIPYQSEMSGILVGSILEQNRCDLPTLAESVNLHRVFINSMLGHWRRVVNPDAASLPIT